MNISLILLILGLCLFLFLYANSITETFENNECSQQFLTNSFCQYDENEQKCTCKFQKDDIKMAFFSSPGCCNRMCEKYNREDCLKVNKQNEVKYYCNIAGKCIEKTGSIESVHNSANNCGTDPLNNQLLLPYDTIEKCEQTLDVCDQYNDPTTGKLIDKQKCLADVNCGFCTGANGIGKCISGTESGPNDLQKYYYCSSYHGSKDYMYEYGDHMTFLLQK